MKMLRNAMLAMGLMLAASTAHAGAIINEWDFFHDYFWGTFVELKASPNEDLTSLTLISVDPNTSGILGAISLAGRQASANGHFVIGSADVPLVDLVESTATQAISESSLIYLVSGFTGNVGDLLDTDANGTFDATPWLGIADSVQRTGSDLDTTHALNILGPEPGLLSGGGVRSPEGGTWRQYSLLTAPIGSPGTANPPMFLSITRLDQTYTSATTVRYRVIFSEPVTGVVTGSFQGLGDIPGVFSPTVSNVSGSGDTYTVTLTGGSGNKEFELYLSAEIATTIQNSAGLHLTPHSYMWGPVYVSLHDRPTCSSIDLMGATPSNAGEVFYKVTFPWPVLNLDVSNFTLGGTAAPGASVAEISVNSADTGPGYFTTDVGRSWFVGVNTGPGNGMLSLNLTASLNNVRDQANNRMNAAFTSGTPYIMDKVAPTVASINRTSANPSNGVATFGVTFSEAVTGLSASNLTLNGSGVSGASVSNVGGSGTAWTVGLDSGSGDGTLGVNLDQSLSDIVDAAGNPMSVGFTSGQMYTIDRTSPTAVLSSVTADPTGATPIAVTVAFSENVTGFSLAGLTLGNATATNLSGSGANYGFDIVPSGPGIASVSLNAGAAHDAAGNGNVASASLTRDFTNTWPSVTMSSATADPTNSATIPVTVTFSSPVTGFTASDIVLVNAAVSGFAGSGANYSFNLLPTLNGTAAADIPAGVAVDASLNPNNGAAQFHRVFDTVPPTATMSSVALNPTKLATIPVTVTFDGAVTGFTASDIVPANASVSGFSGGGANYTFNLLPAGSGTVAANINGAAVHDAAGNPNLPPASFTRLVDYDAPVGSMTPLSDPTIVGTALQLPWTATDGSGSGVADTRLYAKSPLTGSTLADTGIHAAGTSGQFAYNPPIPGVYQFAAVSTDALGNVEAAPGAAETFAIVNLHSNAATTYTTTASSQTLVYPMATDLDVSITLTGATIGGQLSVQRVSGRPVPPSPLDPNRLIGERLIITGSGLGTFDATLSWTFDPASAATLAGPITLIFQSEGGVLIRSYPVIRNGNTLTISHIHSFSTWYAGNVPNAVDEWTRY